MSTRSVSLVPDKTAERLTEKQYVDYRAQRESFCKWLGAFGKQPDEVIGYADDTVERTMRRCGKFDRFVWDQEGGYTIPRHEHADAFLKHLAYGDYSGSHKVNTRASLLRYFNWRHHEYGEDEWEPEITFTKNPQVQPNDYLTREERQRIRTAALDYGSIPNYAALTPGERQRWKQFVAQRLRKPIDEVTPDDWKQLNGWKFTSLVWVSLDTGLRPAEVARATTAWCDTANGVLRIPATESTKNTENWHVSLTERTSQALERWLEERENYDLYDGTNALWLTREGNPYSSASLRKLLHRLCDLADIETGNRSMSWYTIRHSVGTLLTREEDLAATKAQLRHRSVITTTKYDQISVEDRRSALDKMG